MPTGIQIRITFKLNRKFEMLCLYFSCFHITKELSLINQKQICFTKKTLNVF